MENRTSTSRAQQVSRVAGVLTGIVVLVTLAAEVMMIFSDLGPGETDTSRNALMESILVVGGVSALILLSVSWFARRRKG